MTTLVNFRVEEDLKETFDGLCRFNHSNRTMTLIGLMRRYITEMSPQIEEFNKSKSTIKKTLKDTHRSGDTNYRYQSTSKTEQPLERWGDLIKDPSTQNWISIDEWKSK